MIAVLEKECDFYKENITDWQNKYWGLWVLVHGRELIGIFPKYEIAETAGIRLFGGREPYLLTKIGLEPSTPPYAPYHERFADAVAKIRAVRGDKT